MPKEQKLSKPSLHVPYDPSIEQRRITARTISLYMRADATFVPDAFALLAKFAEEPVVERDGQLYLGTELYRPDINPEQAMRLLMTLEIDLGLTYAKMTANNKSTARAGLRSEVTPERENPDRRYRQTYIDRKMKSFCRLIVLNGLMAAENWRLENANRV